MKNLSKGSVWGGPLQPIAAFSLFSLIFLSISRVLLAFWQLDRIDSFNDLIYILGQGLRVDIATLCWLFILLHCFLPNAIQRQDWAMLEMDIAHMDGFRALDSRVHGTGNGTIHSRI